MSIKKSRFRVEGVRVEEGEVGLGRDIHVAPVLLEVLHCRHLPIE